MSPFSSAELFFQPGVSELEIAVNIIDDDTPEVEERFRVSLKNPKGGAEIGFRSQVTVIIPANDDAYGIVGFAQVLQSVIRQCILAKDSSFMKLVQ